MKNVNGGPEPEQREHEPEREPGPEPKPENDQLRNRSDKRLNKHSAVQYSTKTVKKYHQAYCKIVQKY
jgi:hypothetical protein